MNFNFELILFYVVLVTGAIALFDILILAPKRKARALLLGESPAAVKMPIISEYARSFFPVLVLVFFIRSFLFEPFRIPTGSLEPTLLIGDFILTNKYALGIRLPVLHKKIYALGTPMRGDIIVFRWPPNPSIDFIKRVVGVPGDHISYINKVLTINGKEIPQSFIQEEINKNEEDNNWEIVQKQEDLFGVKHAIYQYPDKPQTDFRDVIVPPHMYFVMGDNRDDSADSRFWGFVPDENIVGKANRVWMSWDSFAHKIRWNRIGQQIN